MAHRWAVGEQSGDGCGGFEVPAEFGIEEFGEPEEFVDTAVESNAKKRFMVRHAIAQHVEFRNGRIDVAAVERA
ncbi:hypothetical protein LY13_001655 [Prauserella aidingensis]|uniref:hypothetical protein n=1 Tax=Prauserella aidingensis TaxID=387890 RepID=UPI0020A37A73|nr:hypothetical protein [Prauserella aidingensis]MCP2252911.1 hypothetical protein [Prauserella aidingensis]